MTKQIFIGRIYIDEKIAKAINPQIKLTMMQPIPLPGRFFASKMIPIIKPISGMNIAVR